MNADQFTPPTPRKPSINFLTAFRLWDWPTIALFLGCAVVWAVALMLPVALAVPLLIVALTLHSSLSHEILHGHPFRSEGAGTALGLMQPGLFVPYLRFKSLHLAHHKDANLTDPYDDPETQYLDPKVWVRLPRALKWVLRWNNTLLGRIVIGPLIGTWAFVQADIRAIRRRNWDVAWHWLAHLPGVGVTLWIVTQSAVPVWAYLMACYGALAVLRIRTYLEHRAHDRSSGRSVIIEDRGVLAFLFLNNNFHAVHHMHPQVSWYRLPALYQARKERFQEVNQGYLYRSYAEIFARYFLRAKEPVAHPLWRSPKD